MVQCACQETSITKAHTVMIGDTTYDIEMGRAAGVHTIGVTWGYHTRAELDDAGAHIIIESYQALPGAIAQLLKKDAQA